MPLKRRYATIHPRPLEYTGNATLCLVVAKLFLAPAHAGTDLAAALLPLHSTPQTDILVHDKLPHDVDPALVHGQLVVEFVRDAVQLGEPGPRDRREVVVLVVQADVVGEEVENAVVRVRLRDGDLVRRVRGVLLGLLEDIVLGDEVAGAGVQRAGQKAAQDQICQRFSSCKLDEGVVKGELDDNVEQVNLGERQVVDEHGPQGIEQDLACAEEGLAGDRVEEPCLEIGGQVGVEAIHAERLVVGQVVGAEGGAVGDANGQVREDGDDAVGQGRAEGEVVGDFVDGQEEVLVGGGADDVGGQEEGPRQERRVAEEAGAEDLDGHDEQDDVFGEGLRAAELGDLHWSALAATMASRAAVPRGAP